MLWFRVQFCFLSIRFYWCIYIFPGDDERLPCVYMDTSWSGFVCLYVLFVSYTYTSSTVSFRAVLLSSMPHNNKNNAVDDPFLHHSLNSMMMMMMMMMMIVIRRSKRRMFCCCCITTIITSNSLSVTMINIISGSSSSSISTVFPSSSSIFWEKKCGSCLWLSLLLAEWLVL